MKVRNIDVQIVKGDLTELAVDAIVNAANNELVMGGGVAGVIKRKGGAEIEAEAVKLAPIKVGEAVATKAGKLKAKYVIHAATMALDHKTDEHLVRSSCASAFKRAAELGLSSIAFPALGCGVGRFPLIACAKILSQEALRVARDSAEDAPLESIIFCLYDDEAFGVFEKQVYGYLRHVIEDLAWGPYICVDGLIEVDNGIVIIERTNPPFGFALPGGFVDRGESLETAVRREAMEETGLELADLKQFHTYSDPKRDPRFHTITTMFTAKGVGKPVAGDDAGALKVVPFGELRKMKFAFDHNRVIEDYLRSKGL